MDLLKKFFPYSFETTEVSHLVIRTIVYVVAAIIGGALLGLIGVLNGLIQIPLVTGIIGTLLSLIGAVIELYCTAGIVVMFLSHFKVIK